MFRLIQILVISLCYIDVRLCLIVAARNHMRSWSLSVFSTLNFYNADVLNNPLSLFQFYITQHQIKYRDKSN